MVNLSIGSLSLTFGPNEAADLACANCKYDVLMNETSDGVTKKYEFKSYGEGTINKIGSSFTTA